MEGGWPNCNIFIFITFSPGTKRESTVGVQQIRKLMDWPIFGARGAQIEHVDKTNMKLLLCMT